MKKQNTARLAQKIYSNLLKTIEIEQMAGIERDWNKEELAIFSVLLASATAQGAGVRLAVRSAWHANKITQSKNEMFSLVRSMRSLASA
jgi:hypothetical protein